MITNKDIRVENGFLIINGDKFPLDGQSPETIMEIVENNSDSTPTENSTAPVTSGGVYTALGSKQDTLTFDSAPTDASTNPVTSGGLYNTIGDLTQTGVTGASVADQISNINTYLDDLIITQEFSGDIASLAGNTDITVSIPVAVPSGYKILGVAAAVAGSRNVAITGTLISTNAVSTYVYNLFSTALTNIKVYVVVEFIKA